MNAAIDRGVAWVRGREGADGYSAFEFTGYEGAIPALVAYTLRVCGVARDDPTIGGLLNSMRKSYEAQKAPGQRKTYTVALMCMALAEEDARPVSADRSAKSGRGPVRLPRADVEWLQDMARWLERGQCSGAWSYSESGSGYDHSNTQFAILGLRAATRGGARVEASTWARALEHYLEAQEADGPEAARFAPAERGTTTARVMDRARGWGYRSRSPAYGSMTASGVASVVVCRSQLERNGCLAAKSDTAAERAIGDGIAWLGTYFSVSGRGSPGPSGVVPGLCSAGYYLYSLERAGMLAGVEWMGERDWYGEGAEVLVRRQSPCGAWAFANVRDLPELLQQHPNVMIETCWALLFLRRGTRLEGRPAITRPAEDTIDVGHAATLDQGDFEDRIDLIVSRWQRVQDTASRDRLLDRATSIGPRIVLPLVFRLGSTRQREREAAFALLRRATGLDHGYDPGAPRERLEAAVARWEAWWLANREKLRYDPASRRIVAD